MLVQYFNQEELSYSNRKRFNNINVFNSFSSEEQKAIQLGNGAYTSIKTSKNNICNYVMIDETRWFVISYAYLNGGQIQLNLQRDVVGEFGISGCYGRVDRGITNTILKNRKELSLNQILKSRKRLIPEDTIYGNYFTDTHNSERWGLIYFVKPTDGSESVTINIPEFQLNATNNESLIDNGRYNVSKTLFGSNSVIIQVFYPTNDAICYLEYKVIINTDNNRYFNYFYYLTNDYVGFKPPSFWMKDNSIQITALEGVNSLNQASQLVEKYIQLVVENLNGESSCVQFPSVNVNAVYSNYVDGGIIKDGENYYTISSEDGSSRRNCSLVLGNLFSNFMLNSRLTIDGIDVTIALIRTDEDYSGVFDFDASNFYYTVKYKDISFTEISPEDAGSLVLETSKDLIDEPYIIYAVPLFNCRITSKNDNTVFNIDGNYSFNVFNTVIQFLSGQSGYIVDAQIYPYCPDLSDVATNFKGVPFFNIQSNAYDRICSVDLLPFEDVKKEYICRQYSIVSPDQSDKFTFNFYDYKVSPSGLNVVIRTALKPFAIISSAVIQIDDGALKGINYNSELVGCQPSSNGFEVSLSTNQYQEYMRNNSNYEKIFNKNQEYLLKQHEVEQKNEEASRVANTVSASIMGAIGGASLGSAIGSFGTPVLSSILGGVSAAAGGIAAGTIVSNSMKEQIDKNNELRDYELSLQKELFDLNIGTVKNLPNTISRISSFNEVIMKDFWFVIETYECSEFELELVEEFLSRYSYFIGVYSYFVNYCGNGSFIKGNLLSSTYIPVLHNIANKELSGGIYYYGS